MWTGEEQLDHEQGVNTHSHINGVLVPMRLAGPSSSDNSFETSDSDSDASIPAVLPEKKAKTTQAKTQAGDGSQELDWVKETRQTIQAMEAEFRDVLKAEQERHQTQINTLKAEHEQELRVQREKYETRMDDLISIMKSVGRSN
ncbi:Uu.00g040200.m01.CDS01 [Anthostomella pinea]|uniref:Uu.00g040200.m01.CDS01 n=1 Tax=Anthostomella pinea TaxID=933095 RepID=A0AAI8YDX5_9PEZI|nr:Uu.00g040200.m01.CDS01 [Anthostomella pinea]